MSNEIIKRIQELSEPISEMAMADLKGADLKADSAESIASTYIKNARGRGMDEKKIVASLGATFRGAGKEMDADKVADIKAEVKKQLGVETKTKKSSGSKTTGATLTKKAKEDETYQGTEKVKSAAKRAADVMDEQARILELAGVLNEGGKMYGKNTKMYSMKKAGEKMYSKDGDKFYTKDGKKMYCKSTDKMYSMDTEDKDKMYAKDGKSYYSKKADKMYACGTKHMSKDTDKKDGMTNAGKGKKAYGMKTYAKDTDKKDVYMSKMAEETEDCPCKICGEVFHTERSLEKHMRAEH